MQAKSGKAISAVKPAAPEEVFDADEADAGKVEKIKAEQIKKKQGKYGKQKVKPFKPKSDDDESDATETSWIEFEMIDEADQPVPGLSYEVRLPDGSVETGTLDGNGFARIDGCDPGTCEISFPGLDKDAWERI